MCTYFRNKAIHTMTKWEPGKIEAEEKKKEHEMWKKWQIIALFQQNTVSFISILRREEKEE